MTPHSQNPHSFTEMIERLMEEEREAAEVYRRKARQADDPQLQSIFESLASKRDQFFVELESQVRELRSQNEITTQINSMFW